MKPRPNFADQPSVTSTKLVPFIADGEVRYRLLIEKTGGSRSEFVLTEADLTAHIKQLVSAAHMAAGLIIGEIAA